MADDAAAAVAHASSRVAAPVRAGSSFAAVNDMRNIIEAAAYGPPAQPPGRWHLLPAVDVVHRRPATSESGGGGNGRSSRESGENLDDWVRRMKETSRPPRGGPVALSTGIQTDKLRRAIEGDVGPPRPRTQSRGDRVGFGGEGASWNRPGTSGADGSGVWNRAGIGGAAGAGGRRRKVHTAAGGARTPGGDSIISSRRPATRSGAGTAAAWTADASSRLPEKVRPLPPAPAKPIVNWRPETRGFSYGAVIGAVTGQALATDGELRRWGLI